MGRVYKEGYKNEYRIEDQGKVGEWGEGYGNEGEGNE